MKHALLLSTFYLFFLSATLAQTTPASVEKKITENICGCISALDFEKITDKQTAERLFVECFSKETNLLIQLAEEKKIDVTDQVAMRQLGVDVGKNLMKDNCQGFIKLSIAMVKEPENGTLSGTQEGKLKRIDTKDFNYFVLADNSNQEKSFIWLRQFPGSEDFTANAAKFTGKKLKINWQEIEVYIPSAKNYYKIKEVTGIEVL
ncbi:hypothetical protein [Rufibacter sp. XAAS-G3-1]|uniref:hypothetical protein n=1 Tax=Rufibacter sp. XAAS-G3-1 TaxID=2729134 RepID=UPI0015E75B9E|nr:hypothetical protein [Rufibacter sp. XAAS-G3-1]